MRPAVRSVAAVKRMVNVASTKERKIRSNRPSWLRPLFILSGVALTSFFMQGWGEELSLTNFQLLTIETAVDFRKRNLETGAFANCTASFQEISMAKSAGIVSCRTVHFVASKETLRKSGDIIIGVISSAKNFDARQDIRTTWAKKGLNSDAQTVLFVVAGPWEDVKAEQNKYGDLIWIDTDESFRLITYKTSMLLQVVNLMASEFDLKYSHVLKTDDDSYVAVKSLERFVQQQDQDLNYWGKCRLEYLEPIRNPASRYFISREEYPERIYPPYCTGAGILISRATVECMTTNMKHARFLAMEDVYLGLLAGRCGVFPTHDESNFIRKYRVAGHDSIKKDKTAASWLPNATMKGRIIQHELYNHNDMMAHHAAMNNETDERRKSQS
jgi:hypothetical protein